MASLISEEEVSSSIKAKGVMKTSASFRASTRNIGRPAGADAFPEKVVYPQSCRVFCERDVGRHTAGACLLGMFADAAKWCKNPSAIGHADMLLVAEASSATPSSRSFWWMLSGSFQSGHHLPLQTFWRCFPTDGIVGFMYQKTTLAVQRLGQVAMIEKLESPFDRQAAMPAFFSEEDVARCIVAEHGGDDMSQPLCAQFDVTLRKLRFVESEDSTLALDGEDTSFPALRMPRRPRPAVPSTTPATLVGPDFLSLMDGMDLTSAGSHAPPTTARDEIAQMLTSVPEIKENPWEDKMFQDGLAAAIGPEACAAISAVQLELEEDDEAAEEAAETKAGAELDALCEGGSDDEANAPRPSPEALAPEVGNGDEGGARAPPPDPEAPLSPLPSPPLPPPPLPPCELQHIHGVDVLRTGCTSGIIAKVFSAAVPASSSSGAAARPRLPIGIMHRINDQGLKMACKQQHNSCVCWLSLRGHPREQVFDDLIKWIAAGAALDEQTHWAQSNALKKRYGMRINK